MYVVGDERVHRKLAIQVLIQGLQEPIIGLQTMDQFAPKDQIDLFGLAFS